MSYQSKYTGNDIDTSVAITQQIFNLIYPIGSYYIFSDSTNPSTKFGGTWEQIKDKMIMAAGSSYAAGATGGSATHAHTTGSHTLTVAEIPAHTHTRGTMDITGFIASYSSYNLDNDEYWRSGCGGAFYKGPHYRQESSTLNQSSDATADTSRWVDFSGARSWTGATSAVGGNAPHNHGSTESSSHLPPYIVAYIWRRTA